MNYNNIDWKKTIKEWLFIIAMIFGGVLLFMMLLAWTVWLVKIIVFPIF